MEKSVGQLSIAAHEDRIGPSQPPVVVVRHLVRNFGPRRVLNDLQLSLRAGEFVALLGRSGSGKSTLLKALANLDNDVGGSGELTVPANYSVAFQDSRLLPWLRLLDNVILGLDEPDAPGKGRRALAEVGLAGRERAWPNALSGGEQQRAALARSLARKPELLLADEPFGALDALTRINMQALLRRLCEEHRPAVLFVTHDVEEAIGLADRVIVLQDGVIHLELPIIQGITLARHEAQFSAYRKTLLDALGVTR
ncbi:ABC transporter ATP-binding protein [Sodalis sp. RH21]|uniref:ABC transporter ATP-binding protein n=1 Tax=unclassified Sodalis (in: enterobacteria) TaxID=2636512 RepID=UPI0039B38C32